jgi:hypothetical protein
MLNAENRKPKVGKQARTTSDTKPQTPVSMPKPPGEWSKTLGSITSRRVGSGWENGTANLIHVILCIN